MDLAQSNNPLLDAAATDADDMRLVAAIRTGDRAALEQLVNRHRRWIYNIALRMLYHRDDAEDVTQEVLLKALTKLDAFAARSSFRTWLYRIVVNHVLNMKRRKGEEAGLTFVAYAEGLDGTAEEELPDPYTLPVDQQVIIEEARLGCTAGMLLCLDREQRLVYVLGAIFGVSDVLGAELLEITRENFRQKLARARRDLHRFMDGQCGLIKASNPCRCAKKARGFMRAGYLDPANLLFANQRVAAIRDVAPARADALDELDAAYAEIQRAHPFQQGPDHVAAVRLLLDDGTFKGTLDLN